MSSSQATSFKLAEYSHLPCHVAIHKFCKIKGVICHWIPIQTLWSDHIAYPSRWHQLWWEGVYQCTECKQQIFCVTLWQFWPILFHSDKLQLFLKPFIYPLGKLLIKCTHCSKRKIYIYFTPAYIVENLRFLLWLLSWYIWLTAITCSDFLNVSFLKLRCPVSARW